MKVVSFVPSLTETLIECGVEVVGRTRYCLHPSEKVKDIAVVGGTKDVNWDKVKALSPNILLFDREENLKEMAAASPFPTIDTHVTSVESLAHELEKLGEALNNSKLKALAIETRALKSAHREIPVIKWLHSPQKEIKKIVYLIWKNPWMAVSRETYIGSVLEMMGHRLETFDTKYPKIELENYDRETTLLLFSSEPFPFAKQTDEITKLGFPSALVDGELFSWFGLRSIRFLQSHR